MIGNDELDFVFMFMLAICIEYTVHVTKSENFFIFCMLFYYSTVSSIVCTMMVKLFAHSSLLPLWL